MLVTRDKVKALLGDVPADDRTAPGVLSAGPVHHVVARTPTDFNAWLEQLGPEQTLHMASHGRWSMHQLLAHLVKKAGPSDVWLTSWTITENPIRSILQLRDQGLIKQLRCVFDERVAKQNANGAQLAFRNIAAIGLTGIHAKCMVVIGADTWYTVTSTANITRNKRIELYVISRHRATAEFHAHWVDDVLKNCKPWQTI